MWDVATGELKHRIPGHFDAATSVAFSPDGTVIASGSEDGTVKLWDVATATEKRTLLGHTYHVYSVAFSPDGKLLASGALEQLPEEHWEGTVKIWNVATGEELRTIRGISGGVKSIAFTPDGGTIVAASGVNRQGQRTLSCLSGAGMDEEFVAPAAGAAFHGQAVFAWVLFEQRQREAVQPGEVLPQMLVSDS